MAIATDQPTIYISYSHKDKKWLDRVFKHLQVLQQQGRVGEFRIWADTDIKPGDRWQEAIDQTLHQATLAILLVSPDYLASEFVNEVEARRLLERSETERLPIIPIIVRPCNWQQVNWLAQFQVFTANGKALSEIKNVDKELTRVAEVIAQQLERMATPPHRPPGKGEVQVAPVSEEIGDREPERETERGAEEASEEPRERAKTPPPEQTNLSSRSDAAPPTTTNGGGQANAPVAPQPAEQAPASGGDAAEPPLEADPRRRMPGFSPDTYTETDLLGIEDDVRAFATLIAARAVTPPLSIGLFGDWGSGKTFFMRHLRREVEQVARDARDSKQPQSEIAFYKHIVQIEFNAWHYGEGNLWAGLVEHIFRNLRLNKNDAPAEIAKRQEHMLDQLASEKAAEAKASAAVQQAQNKFDAKNQELTEIKQQHADEAELLGQLSQANVVGALLQSIALAPGTKAQINQALEQVGLPQVQQGAADLQDALMAAQSAAKRGRSVLTTLTEAKDRKWRLLLLIIILFAAPAVGLLIAYLMRNQPQGFAQLAAVAGTLATLLTTGAAWIQKQLAWAAGWIKKAEHATHEIDKQVALKQAENNKQMEMHAQQLDLLKAEYLALRREREEAQRRVEQIQTEITQQSAVFRLGRFIQDRAQSDDYRKHLGVLALIRRDFEELSRLMSEDNERLAKLVKLADEEPDEPVRVNRIVLYIDDLDRCPPQQVVAVLQAVHLLLAFQLFVVVVGVDGRWVARALSKQYPELLGGGDGKETTPVKQHAPEAELRATPHDYLEKIFQIPFWLKPLEASHTKRMLRGLLESSIAQASGQNGAAEFKPHTAPTQTAVSSPSHAETQAQTHASDAPAPHSEVQIVTLKQEGHADKVADTAAMTLDSAGTPAGGAGSNSGGGAVSANDAVVAADSGQPEAGQHSSGTVAASTQRPPTDLNPGGLEISAEELQFMEELTPLLGRSPRAVKRFVNVYRLIKSGLAPDERPRFLHERAPASNSRIVMFLLSIATGLPGISREFFEQVQDLQTEHLRALQQAQAAPDPSSPPACLADLMRGLFEQNNAPEPHPELTTLQAWLDDKAHEAWPRFQLASLLHWSKRVARFSFRVKGL